MSLEISTFCRQKDNGDPYSFCTPSRSASISPASSTSSSSSRKSLLSSSPHEVFTSFYISPLRCEALIADPTTPSFYSPGSVFETPRSCSAVSTKRRLGSGGFGTVFVSRYNDRPVARKELRQRQRQPCTLSNELNAFLLSQSPHVVATLGFSVVSEFVHVVSELVEGGNLQTLLDSHHDALDSATRLLAVNQVCLALSHCHSSLLLHLDVKPANILVAGGRRLFKLADFGCSLQGRRATLVDGEGGEIEVVVASGKSTAGGGTIAYQAPELFKGEVPNCRADIYSLGVTAWQILSGQSPHAGIHPHRIVFAVVSQGLRPGLEEIDSSFESVSSLLPSLWHANPLRRPSSSQLADVLGRLITV